MISEAEKARIAQAIAASEEKSAGEIFCVIAHASSGYHLVPVAWSALIALVVPLPLIYFTSLPAGLIYLAQLLAFIVAGVILSLPPIRFRIVPRRAMRERAHMEAMRQFLAQGLHLTERRTGVLIFLSVAERYAEIVADAGINAKVAPAVEGCGRRRRRSNQRRAYWRWACRRGRPMRSCFGRAFSSRRDQPRRGAEQGGRDVMERGSALFVAANSRRRRA